MCYLEAVLLAYVVLYYVIPPYRPSGNLGASMADERSRALKSSLSWVMAAPSERTVSKGEGVKALWALIFAIIIVLTFVIPYAILKDVASLWGAYTFWTLLTAITIALVCLLMRKWRD